MPTLPLFFVTCSLLLGGTAAGSVNATCRAAVVCKELKASLGDAVQLPTDDQYEDLSTINWSQTAWMNPSCVTSPSSAEQVSQVLKAAVAKKVPFAVRSGGHDPNHGDANIDTGILISLDGLAATKYDEKTGIATLEPGARWDSVYDVLDQYNTTVVGGRVMTVGVGGLILGSGLSYLTDLHGVAADNVVSFEVVLPDGRIVEASKTSHPDLFWGLKGGTNNFGIVTKFHMSTEPIYQVWGGVKLFSVAQIPDLIEAFDEYQRTPNKDLYANMHLNLAPSNDTAILTLVYLKPVEKPDAYAPFYKLNATLEQTGFMTLHELMNLFSTGYLPRWSWYTLSITQNTKAITRIGELFTSAPEVQTVKALTGGTFVGSVQPISASAALQGQANGGNALGLQAVNQTWLAINVGWWNEADDVVAQTAIKSFHDKMKAMADEEGAVLDYLFMNDANKDQDVIAGYGKSNVERLRGIQAKYDPDFVMRDLAPGGFKIPL